MMTVVALADVYAAARDASAPWTLLLEEFGGVTHIAATTSAPTARGR